MVEMLTAESPTSARLTELQDLSPTQRIGDALLLCTGVAPGADGNEYVGILLLWVNHFVAFTQAGR
jgi:hypothetical protein